ncbi:hypothetical protein HYH03_013055 [Edaphochlamys debaryana]|uniref:HTH three-helical bundle domain-containing protein n=1 Tax=Edaphochlamys debaryana TaxID=47281 RepID=A0A836BTI0_9CHLO|nr:hypothetical protein HYH03_013055 [Edaphochlamys debaryana]|eukprot:KAG2488365.1 hypothetical protein HYH03_013055 [Edaphochlamys debaryana]
MPGMPPPAARPPGPAYPRWPSSGGGASPWDYGGPPYGMMGHHQLQGAPPAQPGLSSAPASGNVTSASQQSQGGIPAAAAGSSSAGAAPHPAGPHAGQPPTSAGPPGPMPVPQHPAAMRAYPYGPYGPPPPYGHHPGMPGAPPGMMPYPHHPAYPPPPHMGRGHPYYPPAGYPGYPPPPPPGYYRGHPGMPPPYYAMPPPYGPPPGMHPAMYHPPPNMPPPSGPMSEPHGPQDSTAPAASGNTAVNGGSGGSDGGTDPASAAGPVAGKAVGGSSGGGAESEEVGLEAVITLRPGASDSEDPSTGADPSGGPQDGTLGPHGGLMHGDPSHKLAQPPWPHVSAMPPPHAHPHHPHPGMGPGYEWPPPPHPHHPGAMMGPYAPMPPPGSWGGYGGYDHMAAMHHQHAMMSGEMAEDGSPGYEMHMGHLMAGRRQRSLSNGGAGPAGAQQFARKQLPPQPVPGKGYPEPPMSRPGSADASLGLQSSGSLGQLLFNAPGSADGTGNVSRRTQRLKKRRSTDAPGSTPDPFAMAAVAAERAAMGRDPSSGGGAPPGFGYPFSVPMFMPPSGGGANPARRSSNGSERTVAMAGQRLSLQPTAGNRQRSDPGYLIEAGVDPQGGWGPGDGGPINGPMCGLGQLVSYPQHGAQQSVAQQQAVSRRSSEVGGPGGRTIMMPRRYDDAIITLEYPKGPPVAPQPKKHRSQASVAQRYEDDPDEDEEALEQELANGGDDSDEDYEGEAERRVGGYRRAVFGGGGMGGDGLVRKRKAPMTREDPPQPEKKRKARDPATISKVVLNCCIILGMVDHDVVFEKEIRTALGNNPDTSKALRLLMNQGKLVRTGQGGRGNPFCYRCTPLGITTLEKIQAAATPGAELSAGPNAEQRAAAVAVSS